MTYKLRLLKLRCRAVQREQDKRAGMIDLLCKKRRLSCVMPLSHNGHWRAETLSCSLPLGVPQGYRMAVSFNWLLKTPFARSPWSHLQTHTSARTRRSLCLYTTVGSWKTLIKITPRESSALQGLLNSNGCGVSMAWCYCSGCSFAKGDRVTCKTVAA